MLFTNKYRDKLKNIDNSVNDNNPKNIGYRVEHDMLDIQFQLDDAKNSMNTINRLMETPGNMYQFNKYRNLAVDKPSSKKPIETNRFKLINSQPLPTSNGRYLYSDETLEREYTRRSKRRPVPPVIQSNLGVSGRHDSSMNMNAFTTNRESITQFEMFENKPHKIDNDSDSDNEIAAPDYDNEIVAPDSDDEFSDKEVLHILPVAQSKIVNKTREIIPKIENKVVDVYSNKSNLNDTLFDYKKYIQDMNEIKCVRYIQPDTISPIIPQTCYTTWHTHELPPKMKESFDKLCRNNPEIKFEIYDEEKCRKFIDKNYDKDVLDAYDRLATSSYKSDLWRYCVLYRNGGIYIDIKYNTINGFRLLDLCEKEHFVIDRQGYWEPNQIGLYTALIAVEPRNKVLRACIQGITHNAENYYYGHNALYPTGPGLLGQLYFENYLMQNIHRIKDIELFHKETSNEIVYNNTAVLNVYDGYRDEQMKYQNNLHYSKLWDQRAVYNMNIRIIVDKKHEKINTYLPRVCCICHIGSYHIFQKMKTYIDNLVYAQYDAYILDIYFNVVDTISKGDLNRLKNDYPTETVIMSENYGFDIGSFFHILEHIKKKKYSYDYLLKIHTKTNNQSRTDLLDPILGSSKIIRDRLTQFEQNSNVGLIASKKARCIDAHVDFTRNQIYLQQLLKFHFNETTNVCKQAYVSGTMFWVRFSLIEELFMKCNLPNIYNSMNNIHTFDWNWYYYANMKHIDNTPLHQKKLYEHYIQHGKTQRLSGNIFHAIKYDTKSVFLRDGMIEHAYERFFCYGLHRLGHKLLFVT